jgi:putative transposase
MSKTVEITQNTKSIIRSFKRPDVRIREKLAAKYGRRRSNRTKYLLHCVSKRIVQQAKTHNQVIVFEEISGLRGLYRKGSGHGRAFRAMMNSFPFYEIKRQTEYKGAWEKVPIITLTKGETMGTTMDCPRCGERLQLPIRGDHEHYRLLWCEVCKGWRDRDLVAVLNISRRGWLRFDHSKGEADEAVKRNPRMESSSWPEPVILRVDVSKLCRGQQTQQNPSTPSPSRRTLRLRPAHAGSAHSAL